ncbi:hypothetical protein ACFQV2_07810 [Actinokineospora soli]|uniref:Uncharacterized protein n=1 Tax=Actinokineospora soli TaxID=1048753 RepID=A0ABW2TIF1_9PSEU
MTGPDAGAALRALALDPRHRAAFQSSPELRAVLWPAAARFILAHDRAGLPDRLAFLAGHGYRIGLEFVGEEVSDPAEVEAVVAEYESLIETPWPGVPEPRGSASTCPASARSSPRTWPTTTPPGC